MTGYAQCGQSRTLELLIIICTTQLIIASENWILGNPPIVKIHYKSLDTQHRKCKHTLGMSGAEVLVILPIVAALISAFKDSTDLGDKARNWWKKHWGKERYALKAAADSALDQSLSINPVRIQEAYSENVQRYGIRFAMGDGT